MMTPTTPSPSSASVWLYDIALGVARLFRRYGLLLALVPFFFPQLVPGVSLDIVRFVSGLIAFIPLTTLIASATEELAEVLGQFIGGLLNVVFSNASDLALTGMLLATAAGAGVSQARRGEMIEIVLYYSVGLILCHILLFPGLATFLGSLRHGRMRFDREQAVSYTHLLGTSLAILLLPSLAYKFASGVGSLQSAALLLLTRANLTLLSDITAVLLFVIYLLFVGSVVFQFDFSFERRAQNRRQRAARRRAAASDGDDTAIRQLDDAMPDTQALFAEEHAAAEARLYEASAGAVGMSGEPRAARLEQKRQKRQERDERRAVPSRPLRGFIALLVLALATAVLVVVGQSVAIGVAHGILSDLHLNPLFAGLIVFPLVVSLVETYGAVGAAWNNRMEITFAVASGSAISWVLLGVPVLMLVSHLVGLGALPLLFGFFLVASLGIAFYLYFISTRSGETTWIEGLQMILFFAAVAVVAGVSSVVAQ